MDQLQSTHQQLHKDVLTYRNPAPKQVDRSDFPPGFVYVENFFSIEEQSRILNIIDSHAFAKEIVRQQQFYGPVYYFTPQALRSSLQPVDQTLSSDIVGNIQPCNNVSHVDPTDSDRSVQSQTLTEEESLGHDTPQQQPNQQQQQQQLPKVTNHDLDPLQWVIDKLISAGLFERADPKDPFVEYIANDHGDGLIRVERDYSHYTLNPTTDHEREITSRKVSEAATMASDPPYIDSTHMLHNEHDLQLDNEAYSWGESSLYPDQILVNEYLPFLSIGAHFDDALSFGPIILGISLGADSTLVLSKPGCLSKADHAMRCSSLNQAHDTANPVNNTFDHHCSDGINNNDQSYHNSSKCQSGVITDIEDIGNDFVSENGTKLSYPISLRDFSRKGWKVGKGPQILSQYCRCTREKLLLNHHQYGKELLTVVKDHNITSSKSQGGDRRGNTTDTPPITTDTTAVHDNNQDDNSQSAKMRRRRQFLRRMHAEIASHYPNGNRPSTEEEMEQFIFSYDYNKLLKDEHAGGSVSIESSSSSNRAQSAHTSTPIGKLSDCEQDHNISLCNDLYSNASSNISSSPQQQQQPPFVFDFTPSLTQINQCKHPVETLEIPVSAGSVYILTGASRYQYRHAIKKMPRKFCEEHPDYRRVSLTVRSLLPGRRQVVENSDVDVTYQNHLFHFNATMQPDTRQIRR